MEIFQYFNEDIENSATADILLVDGELETQQRLYRRLLTATGNYIWHADYGAGLSQYIGRNLTPALINEIQGVIKTQMFLENTVARNPEPVISLSQDGNNLICGIQYVSQVSGNVFTLSFIVGD